MANTIQIKRSAGTATPSSLAAGELAYSFNSDNLFIGDGTTVITIGGEADHLKLAGIEAGAEVNLVDSVAGKTGVVTLVKADLTNFTESDYVHTTGVESIGGNKTFSNNVVITGDLTVNGTTTTVNSTTVNVGDNIMVLNSGEAGTPSLDAGIEIERGTSTNMRLIWQESSDSWGSEVAGGAFTAFSLAGHTHTAANITDFNTSVDARIGAANITDLNDVTITTPSATQVLTYNGSAWVNSNATSGVTAFTGLSDVPSSYTGHGGKFVAVNSGATALEFVTAIDGGSF
jgi:hypothetical protein